MPNWLFEILFFGFMAVAIVWPILWRAVFFTAAGNVYDAITRKPDSPHVETAQEAAMRNIKIAKQNALELKETARINKIRAKDGLPPLDLEEIRAQDGLPGRPHQT